MAKYTAEITNKDLIDGEQITRRLTHLNSLEYLKNTIEIGPFHEKLKIKTEKDIYHEKTNQFLKYLDIARTGLIRSDRPIIGELREWLRDNFKDEYISDF